MFRVTPKPLDSVPAFRLMVQRHRAGEVVTVELLAAIAPVLGRIAPLYQTPGEVVSDFWRAINEGGQSTPNDIGATLRNWRRYERAGDSKRSEREDEWQEGVGHETEPEEGLPPWFWGLQEGERRILLGVLMGEEDRDVGKATGVTNETAKKRRQKLFEELRKKVFPWEVKGAPPKK